MGEEERERTPPDKPSQNTTPTDTIYEDISVIDDRINQIRKEIHELEVSLKLSRPECPAELFGLVKQLREQSNDTAEGVYRKALNLYRLALQANREGNRLVILSPDDVIVHEVVGFGQAKKGDLQITG
jgi:hypothetical protein